MVAQIEKSKMIFCPKVIMNYILMELKLIFQIFVKNKNLSDVSIIACQLIKFFYDLEIIPGLMF